MATAQLGAVLRHIRKLAADHRANEQTDGALLRAFLGNNDQPAFEALMRRHGPMVLRVCLRASGNAHDAEDACQATFLVLARQAKSIRKRESLASWLHGVAYRMATHAKRAAARRHRHESRVSPTRVQDPALRAAWQEIQVLLDEGIGRLPETLRAPYCCLENKSSAEAAQLLGLEDGTVRKRMSRARKLIQERLTRRGVSLTTLLVAGAVGANGASAAVFRSLVGQTVKAAAQIALGQAVTGGSVSTQVLFLVKGVNQAMFLAKCKMVMLMLLAPSILGVGLTALQGAASAKKTLPAAATGSSEVQQARSSSALAPKPDADAAQFSGRVLGPDGKPFQGAQVYLVAAYGEPTVRAKTDAEGRFEFRLRRGEVVGPDKQSVHTFQVLAAAEGYGPAWINADDSTPARQVVLRLVKDDIPIEG